MSRKYEVRFDGSMVSSSIIPDDWEVVQLSKEAVAKVIAEIDWSDRDELLEYSITEDVMNVAEVVPLHKVPKSVRDKSAQHAFDQIDLAA